MNATGILIDPDTRTVSHVEVKGDYTAIYPIIDARCFTVAPIKGDGDGIYLDDNGLFSVGKAVWYTDLYPEGLIGKGLIMGTDEEGESVSPVIDIETVRQSIRWERKGVTLVTVADTMRKAKEY